MRRRNALADPLVSSVVVFVPLAIVGLIMLALGWRGTADKPNAVLQLSYVVSAGLGGLALLGLSLGVLLIQHRRWLEARRRAELEPVLHAAANLLAAAQAERET